MQIGRARIRNLVNKTSCAAGYVKEVLATHVFSGTTERKKLRDEAGVLALLRVSLGYRFWDM